MSKSYLTVFLDALYHPEIVLSSVEETPEGWKCLKCGKAPDVISSWDEINERPFCNCGSVETS